MSVSEDPHGYNHEGIRQAGKRGILGVRVPAAQGGQGHSFRCFAAISEILARSDFGFALALANTVGIATKLAEEANGQLQESFLPGLLSGELLGCAALTEPGAGSDLTSLGTTARKERSRWLISGQKAWITNGVAARVAVVYVQTQPGSGAKGIASFVVDADRAGFFRDGACEVAALHTAGLGGFRLENYQAHDDEMLQPPGRGFKAAMALVNNARTYVAAMCCGMVAQALDVAYAYGSQRSTFGKPLLEHQGWRWPLADAMTDLAAARGLVQAACDRIDTGEDVPLEAAQAKLFATRMAERHLPRLSHAMGAEGLRKSQPFARHQVAARAANLVDGSTEMLLERAFTEFRNKTANG